MPGRHAGSEARRADPAERLHYACKAVLAWVSALSDQQPLRIEEFFDSREIFFLGESLTPGEVARTLSYLEGARLIRCTGPVFRTTVRSQVSLTDRGVECLLSGSDVGEYVARRRESERPVAGGTVFTGPIHGPVAGRDMTVQGDLTVQQTFQAADLAAAIRQFAPALGMDESSLRELLDNAGRLLRQADTDADDGWDDDWDDDADDDGYGARGAPGDGRRGRMQALVERIRSLLQAAPESVGRQLMLDAVGQMMARLLG